MASRLIHMSHVILSLKILLSYRKHNIKNAYIASLNICIGLSPSVTICDVNAENGFVWIC